jgi:hypothetical protein
MLSVESFVKRCETAIQEGAPFIAYRHDQGYGLLYTEMAYTSHQVVVSGLYVKDVEHKRTRCPRQTVNRLRNQIKAMRKDPHVVGLAVVEFDGKALRTEGDGLDDLHAVPIPGDRDPVDN